MRKWGAQAEAWVREQLRTRGWIVLDQNWSCRWGELDLVILRGERLLIVEVKGRRLPLRALSAVDRNKRRRIARAINCWRAQYADRGDTLLEVVIAVVPLPPAAGPVRWIGVHELC